MTTVILLCSYSSSFNYALHSPCHYWLVIFYTEWISQKVPILQRWTVNLIHINFESPLKYDTLKINTRKDVIKISTNHNPEWIPNIIILHMENWNQIL